MSKKGKRRFRKPSLRTRAAIYALFTASAVLCAVSYKQWQDGQRRYWEQMQHVEAMKLNKSLSGNYLAARFAVAVDDLRSASHYYDRSLEYTKDKDFIIQRALPAAIGAGDIKEALRLSQGMDLKQPSLNAQLGVMVQLIDAFKRSDAAKVAELLPLMREEGFGRLLSPLIMTWSEALKQKPAEAVARLDQMEKEYPTVKPLINAQKAVVYEVQKKNDLAEKYFLKII